MSEELERPSQIGIKKKRLHFNVKLGGVSPPPANEGPQKMFLLRNLGASLLIPHTTRKNPTFWPKLRFV